MTQEDINEVMANSLKRYQLESLVFDGGNIESAKRLICLLQAENAQLKAQLTWRPVSEKPKDGQIVFAMIPTGWVVAQYFNGGFYVDDGFTFGDSIGGVTHWLHIPPAPEVT